MLKIGDRVSYTPSYLKSLNIQAAAEYAPIRGVITDMGKTFGKKLHMVRVRWDGDDRDRSADITVLQPVSTVNDWHTCDTEQQSHELQTLVAPHLKPGLVAGSVECRNGQWGFTITGRVQDGAANLSQT